LIKLKFFFRPRP